MKLNEPGKVRMKGEAKQAGITKPIDNKGMENTLTANGYICIFYMLILRPAWVFALGLL